MTSDDRAPEAGELPPESGMLSDDARTPAQRRPRWRLVIGIVLTVAIVVLAVLNRAWLLEALGLARAAKLAWLLPALITIMLGFLVSSTVLRMVIHSLGHRAGVLRMWATSLVAIVMSQLFLAGGVGSYAFLLDSFRRRGLSAGEAALVATLEALSYGGAMLIFSIFGLAYLTSRILAADPDGSSLLAPLLAVGLALVLLGGAAFVLTRSSTTLACWLLRLHHLLFRLLRRPRGEEWVQNVVAEIDRGRDLVSARRGLIVRLVLIQVIALCGQSLGLYMILRSLGTSASFLTVVATFGIALLTSTLNVLPGGGGTVEAALVAVLTQLGVGAEAVPAAILFRLLNFWLILPIAAGCYAWLIHGRAARVAVGPE